MLSVDLKGSLQHLKKTGDLYTDVGNEQFWEDDKIEVMQGKPIPKPKYQMDLDGAATSSSVPSASTVE